MGGGYLAGLTSETFDHVEHLGIYDDWAQDAGLPATWVTDRTPDARAFRREVCRVDPLMFALVYLTSHLRDEITQKISFGDAHLDWCRRLATWVGGPPGRPMADRHAEIAPRSMGKTTWWFLIGPMWAAAYGYVKFIAAFSDAATTANEHLATFKRELEENDLLRYDHPELCSPAKRRGLNRASADRQNHINQANGLVFKAGGANRPALGMKVGRHRPDLILLDDIEKGAENYSAEAAAKRRKTMINVLLALNLAARVTFVGTTTIAGGITDHLANSLTDPDDPDVSWVAEQHFQVHHYLPVLEREDGSERSCWPEKWSLALLTGPWSATADYALNMLNRPVSGEGDYWDPEDIVVVPPDHPWLNMITKTLVSIDPAVTSGAESDWTGIAALGFVPRSNTVLRSSAVVLEAFHVRLGPDSLKGRVRELLSDLEERGYPVDRVLVETNNGGDWVSGPFRGLGVEVETVNQKEKKEMRLARVARIYKAKRVVHARRHRAFESEALAFPRTVHDDVADAVSSGVLRMLVTGSKRKVRARRVPGGW